jgi:hypothetical protein
MRRLSPEVRDRVRGIALKPESFAAFLTSAEFLGGECFSRFEALGGGEGQEGKEFCRPMLVFYK